MDVLKRFLLESDRLIFSKIHTDYIKSSRVKHLENHRAAISKLPEPQAALAVRLLDEVKEFADVLNKQGVKAADSYADKLRATLDELLEQVK